MKKNILIITDAYPPEIRSSSQLMKDLAVGLNQAGFRVFVATSYPAYNLPLSNKEKWPEYTNENGVFVIRIKTLPHHRVNFIIRGIAQLLMPYFFLLKIKKYLKEGIDIIILHSPPLPLAITALKLKYLYKAKFVLNLHDIFPQNAIDLGILRNKFLINFFESLEKKIYQKSDLIVVPSLEHKNYLNEKKGVDKEKIEVIYHYINLEPHLKVNKRGKFRKLYNLEDKFIFLFAGVIGPAQGLDLIIEIANKIKHIKEITFLIVGEGTEKNNLIQKVKELKLENVIFKPFIPLEEYPELVKDCDVGLITISSNYTTPVVPGKLLGYLANKIPVVAFANKESEVFSIIKKANCGYAVLSSNFEEAIRVVLKIYKEKNKNKILGENGFTYLLKNFSLEIALSKWIEVLKKLI